MPIPTSTKPPPSITQQKPLFLAQRSKAIDLPKGTNVRGIIWPTNTTVLALEAQLLVGTFGDIYVARSQGSTTQTPIWAPTVLD